MDLVESARDGSPDGTPMDSVEVNLLRVTSLWVSTCGRVPSG
jgi:hypothetical protein